MAAVQATEMVSLILHSFSLTATPFLLDEHCDDGIPHLDMLHFSPCKAPQQTHKQAKPAIFRAIASAE
jgi:hypothetical protein